MYTLYRVNCNTPRHIYIGMSESVWYRLLKHLKGQGSKFTQKHGLKSFRIIKEFNTEKEAKLAEREETLRLKRMYERMGFRICGAGWSSSI